MDARDWLMGVEDGMDSEITEMCSVYKSFATMFGKKPESIKRYIEKRTRPLVRQVAQYTDQDPEEFGRELVRADMLVYYDTIRRTFGDLAHVEMLLRN